MLVLLFIVVVVAQFSSIVKLHQLSVCVLTVREMRNKFVLLLLCTAPHVYYYYKHL